jgi:hypothetical protein
LSRRAQFVEKEFKAGEDVPLVVEGAIVGPIPVADLLP